MRALDETQACSGSPPGLLCIHSYIHRPGVAVINCGSFYQHDPLKYAKMHAKREDWARWLPSSVSTHLDCHRPSGAGPCQQCPRGGGAGKDSGQGMLLQPTRAHVCYVLTRCDGRCPRHRSPSTSSRTRAHCDCSLRARCTRRRAKPVNSPVRSSPTCIIPPTRSGVLTLGGRALAGLVQKWAQSLRVRSYPRLPLDSGKAREEMNLLVN